MGGTNVRRKRFRTATVSLGEPTVNLDRALQIVGDLEDDLLRKARLGT